MTTPLGARPTGERPTSTRLGFVRVRVIESATAALLQVDVNTFLTGLGTPAIAEEKLIDLQYQAYDSTHYSAMIVYTE